MSPAYFETHFQVEGSNTDWPSEFAIVTAYNTTGETWSPERNSAADTDLAAELAAMGIWRRRITGYSPSTGHAKSFHGSADVASSAAKFRLVQIAEEIIAILNSDPNASIKVSVEISADFPDGATDQIKRAISENAKSLNFGSAEWE